jgi:hypothetical protein
MAPRISVSPGAGPMMLAVFRVFQLCLAVPKYPFKQLLVWDVYILGKYGYKTSDIYHTTSICQTLVRPKFFLILLRYGAQSQCPVRIWAVVLANRFEARSKKAFLGAGGKIVCFPLSVCVSFSIE